MKDSRSHGVQCFREGEDVAERHDTLAVEQPLEIRVRGCPVSITMRTPGHDEELVSGFLFTEGILERPDDLWHVAPCSHDPSGNVINVRLDPRCESKLARLSRFTVSSSSCGVCGKRSLDAVFADVEPLEGTFRIDEQILYDLPVRMRATQTLFGQTGGVHAATLFDKSGALIATREDIGRHNAVDKLIGFALRNDLLPCDDHVLLVSGRASFEIVQKAIIAQCSVVASVSAPSSLAVDLAASHGQTLIGFLRDGRATVYTGFNRIRRSPVRSGRIECARP